MPADLHFLRPAWFLALIPLALLLWHLVRRAGGAAAWRGQIDAHLLPHLLIGGGRRRWPLALLGLAWLLAVTALAGPVWERQPAPAHRSAVERVILLDLSQTMLASDVAPSRLVRARLEVQDLLRAGADGQTALIAFGAEPFLVSPLTMDTATIAAQVPSLSPDLLPVDGPSRTDLALDAAGKLLAGAGGRPGELILVTDGLEQPASAFAAARRLADAGHRLSVLLVATSAGAPVPGADGGVATNQGGSVVTARPDVEALRRLAAIGGGRLVMPTADGADTRALLAGSQGARRAADDQAQLSAERWREEGPWLLILLVPLAALGFRRGWLAPALAVVFLVPAGDSHAGVWQDFWLRPDQQATRDLNAGRAAEAVGQFTDPAWRAAARYRAGDYAGAAEELADLDGAQADYNRGNALARTGRLSEALAAYDQALAAAPRFADAEHNRALVERLLEEQKSQPQSGSPGGQGNGAQQGKSGDSGATGDADGGDADQNGGQPPSESGSQPHSESGPQSQPGAQAGSQSEPQSSPGGTETVQDGKSQQRAASDSRGRPQTSPSEAGEPSASQDRPGHNEQDLESAAAGADNDAKAGDEPVPAGARPAEHPGEQSPGAGGAGELRPGEEPDLEDLIDSRGRPEEALGAGPGDGERSPAEREAQQAFEQMLRRVPDDPAGLLRQRFLLEHLRREGRL